ncbi:MAG TPA: hypothetical protein VJ773_02115, partial [Gemmatimonadales bacterium]|nr:hypothetical protein [Gemmatimonadales bacterium]
LRDRARAVPREVAPPPTVWRAVARATRSPLPVPRSRWSPWALAAAAALLVTLSSAGTAWLLRGGPDLRPSTVDLRPAAALPPRLASLEADYQRAAAELVRALEADPSLSPAAREAVLRHVAVVDAAIAEARALAVGATPDPGAGELLLAAYRQKLDLLERASRLLSDT